MSNLVSDLLPQQFKKSWSSLKPQGKAKVRNDLLKENPDIELWDHLEYFRYNPFNKKMIHPHFVDELLLVSSKGNIKRVDGKTSRIWLSNGTDYPMTWTPGIKTEFMIHRAVCLLFNPVPLNISDIIYSQLHVNHINGVKLDIQSDNLEWVTQKENNQHAVITGLRTYRTGINNHRSVPVLATVKIPGKYENFKFIIAGTAERKRLGFGNNWAEYIDSKDKLFKGCVLESSSDEQTELYSVSPSDDLISLISAYDGTRKGTIIGTHLETGKVIEFNGTNEIDEAGFNNGAVYACCKGKLKQHKGWIFNKKF